MEAKIAPHYLRDLAIWLNSQATTPEMRDVVTALGAAADTIEAAEHLAARLKLWSLSDGEMICSEDAAAIKDWKYVVSPANLITNIRVLGHQCKLCHGPTNLINAEFCQDCAEARDDERDNAFPSPLHERKKHSNLEVSVCADFGAGNSLETKNRKTK